LRPDPENNPAAELKSQPDVAKKTRIMGELLHNVEPSRLTSLKKGPVRACPRRLELVGEEGGPGGVVTSSMPPPMQANSVGGITLQPLRGGEPITRSECAY
jgi:hypothetical protein